ncbi:response regulator [Dictyobacter aurantiacus]|uniref:Two-component system response regulator n=1 Tax=Dictyobacter aurantiacus TaxID=1936993 RepID=A0A401ZHF5_9CHLR|nr:response regulator [Dictyobacter aurantiacus]GCE06310.1 two-component system response regulator [Dictyobacter aurantiacus]
MIDHSDYPLLIVEDNDEDFEVIQWALKKLSITTPIYRCDDGDDALDFLHHTGKYTQKETSPRPALILLDLNLTLMNGQEVLTRIKHDDALKMIPVIIWTTSADPRDIDICFKQGANSYILKPMTFEKLLEAVDLLNQYWFGVVKLPEITEM